MQLLFFPTLPLHVSLILMFSSVHIFIWYSAKSQRSGFGLKTLNPCPPTGVDDLVLMTWCWWLGVGDWVLVTGFWRLLAGWWWVLVGGGCWQLVGVGSWWLGVSGQVLVDELWWTGDCWWMTLCCCQVVSVDIWWWIMDGCWWMDDDGWVLVDELVEG